MKGYSLNWKLFLTKMLFKEAFHKGRLWPQRADLDNIGQDLWKVLHRMKREDDGFV